MVLYLKVKNRSSWPVLFLCLNEEYFYSCAVIYKPYFYSSSLTAHSHLNLHYMLVLSQVDTLILHELQLNDCADLIYVQELLYKDLVQQLDPKDLVCTTKELEPHEDLLQILYVRRNTILEEINTLIQSN